VLWNTAKWNKILIRGLHKVYSLLFKSIALYGGKLGRARAEPDGTRAETRFRLSPKRTSPFKQAGDSVQSTAGSRGVRISVSNAGYTTLRGRARVLATHSIRQFPLHFPSCASPCATTFRTQYTRDLHIMLLNSLELRQNQRRVCHNILMSVYKSAFRRVPRKF
jgi:hypothetical protein